MMFDGYTAIYIIMENKNAVAHVCNLKFKRNTLSRVMYCNIVTNCIVAMRELDALLTSHFSNNIPNF